MLKHFPILLLLCVFVFSGCATEMPQPIAHEEASGPVHIVIDLSDQQTFLYRGDKLILRTQISTGRAGYRTPAGSYRVQEKDIDHRSSVYGAYCLPNHHIVVPDVDVRKTPKPKVTVFIGAAMPYFMRLRGGIGMHGGYVTGYPISHGCIRLPYAAAKQFYEAAEIGTPVLIRQ